MLSEEQVISIKRIGDCYLKLIELVRTDLKNSNNQNTMYKVFSDIHRINNYNEKILYLLLNYVVNGEDEIISILVDTDLLKDATIYSVVTYGINMEEIHSSILKNYIKTNSNVNFDLIDIMDLRKEDTKEHECSSCVDYNLSHLRNGTRDIELKNRKLKRKIRRRILYDKYQGRQ